MKEISIIVIVIAGLICGCDGKKPKQKAEVITKAYEQENVIQDTLVIKTEEIPSPIKITIVPCANGYSYAQRNGTLNPSLQKYLSANTKVKVSPFPFKKMNGSGFHGVYDKKHCTKILKNTNSTFLIMTKMRGDILSPRESSDSTWGYETKILYTKTMKQFKGISASNLPTYEDIDEDIKNKIPLLIHKLEQIIK